MTHYKVEWKKRSLVHTTIIEAFNQSHTEVIAAKTLMPSGATISKLEEVKKHRVVWIEHHSHEVYATDCDDAEQRAIEYADTHGTFDDYGGFDTEEIEEDVPKIEVSEDVVKQNRWMLGAYNAIDEADRMHMIEDGA